LISYPSFYLFIYLFGYQVYSQYNTANAKEFQISVELKATVSLVYKNNNTYCQVLVFHSRQVPSQNELISRWWV